MPCSRCVLAIRVLAMACFAAFLPAERSALAASALPTEIVREFTLEPGALDFEQGDDGVRAAAVAVGRGREILAVRGEALETVELAAPSPAGRALEAPLVELVGRGSMGGETMASILIRHLAPAGSTVRLHTRVRVTIELAPAAGRARGLHGDAAEPLRQSGAVSRYRAALAAAIAGGGEAAAMRAPFDDGAEIIPAGGQQLGAFDVYQPGQFPSLDGSLVEYLIVTSDALAPAFQRLADWKTQSGVPAAVRTISWIEANYPGMDRHQRIRNFLADAYRHWGTLWVLLAGDESVIPSRIAHTEAYGGEDIAADLYYSDLDRDWDGDGDGIFGEGWRTVSNVGDSLDLYPDVIVGRAPVETTAEADIFINKIFTYLRTPNLGYQNDALFVSEVVFPVPWDPGDPIFMNGCDIAHDAADHVPSTWDTIFVCEWPNQNESHASVVSALNAGPHIVTVVGHGDPFKWSTSDGQYFQLWDASGLTNASKLFLLFYANCNTNQVESESIDEFLLLNPSGGAFGTVAATRFDFPTTGRFYHEEFYRLFFEAGVREMGALQALMKVPRVPLSGNDISYERWTQLTYILLGDPQLAMWREVPKTTALTLPPSVQLGDSTVTVTVRGGVGLLPQAGALVTLWKSDGGEYARGLTDASGVVALEFVPGSLGTVQVTSTHASYLPGTGTIPVISGPARLVVESVSVDDDSDGASAGNANGLFEPGERVEVRVSLGNDSGAPADSVVASAVLPGGTALTAYVEVNGLADPDLLFLGAEADRAASLPVELDGTAGGWPAAWGRPLYTAYGLEDTSGVAARGRAYLWQDLSGWHLRAAGGGQAHAFDGWIAGSGPARARQSFDLEGADAITAAGDTLHFHFDTDPTDFEDGLDVVFPDAAGVAVLAAEDTLGTVSAGTGAEAVFVLEAADSAVSRALRFDLPLTAAGGVSWVRGFRVDVAAPALARYAVRVDDPMPGGDGDGLAEAGETVSFDLTVDNDGAGQADDVVATLRATSGATVTDSVRVLGDVPAGTLATATGFTAILASSAVTLELDLATPAGLLATVSFEAGATGAPSVPGALKSLSGSTWAELTWVPSSAGDLRGYHVYRAPQSGGPYQQATQRLTPTAYFRDEGLAPETGYLYRVSAVDSAGNASPWSAPAAVTTGPPLQAGFPVFAWNRVYSSPVPVDLDGNGDVEIVCASQGWKALAWNHDGTVVPGWPRQLGGETISSPAVGNLDGDPQREVVIGANDTKLYAFNHNGTGLLSPNGVFGDTGGFLQCTPALGDLDLDGDLEIVIGSKDGWVYAWHGNGTGYLNPDGKFASFPLTCISAPVLANVDADPYLEIFIGTTGSALYAWNHDGSGFRLPSGQFKYIGNGSLWASPAIGDVDNDGTKEVIAASTNDSVYVYTMTAANKPGWPRATGNDIIASPALGDLDNDGKLEVVAGSCDEKLYAWRWNGTLVAGFPVTLPDSVLGSPVIGDITGDGYPDIVAGVSTGLLYAFQRNGAAVPGWPFRTYDKIWHSAPALADLDHDGDVEVIQGSYDGYVYAWDLSAPYLPATMDWPMFHHDRMRTGFAGWVEPDAPTSVGEGAGDAGILPAVTMLREVGPNPASPRTTIRFDLARPGEVRLDVFDVSGRRVRQLAGGPWPAGRHQAAWDGAQEGGRPAAPGVYFVRLQADGGGWTAKLLLVR